MRRFPCHLALAKLLACTYGGPAGAAGFAVKEHSATALGNAFAGATAGAEDLSYMFFNPAVPAWQSGNQLVGVASYIAPRAELRDGAAATPRSVPIEGSNGGSDIARDFIVPAFYAMWEPDPDLKLALATNVPFGLETDYEAGWIGRYHALDSRLESVNLNPVVAYRFHDRFAVGAGLQLQYLEAELSNAVDFGSIGSANGIGFAVPTTQDGTSKLEGDSIGIGFTAGLLVEPLEGTRLGIAYRSHVRHDIDGDATFTLDNTGVGALLSASSGAFIETGATAEVTTPETLSFGLHQEIGPQWALMGEIAWTGWSRFDELRIEFDNPAQADSVTEEDWRDSWLFAAGVTYRPVSTAALRFGVAYDQSPIPDRRRTPRIPPNNRTWIAAGATYQPFPYLEVGLSYSHILLDDGPVELLATDSGNAARGSLSGSYESSIDIVSLQAVLRF